MVVLPVENKRVEASFIFAARWIRSIWVVLVPTHSMIEAGERNVRVPCHAVPRAG